MEKERIWSRNFIILAMINVFLALIFYLLFVTIALYSVDKFQAPTSIAGLVSGIFVIGALLGRITTGRIIDNMGNREIFRIGMIFFTITTALYLVSNTLTLLLFTRLAQGIAFGVAATAISTIIARILPPHRYGEGLSYFSMSIVLATAIGPFIGIMLIKFGDFNIIFILNLILAVFCLLLAFTVQEPPHKPNPPFEIKKSRKFKVSNYLEYKVLPIALIALIIAFTYSGVTTFISIYAEQINLVEAAGFFFIAFAITVLISRPITGRLFDSKGPNFVMYPCFVIFALGMFLYSQASVDVTLLLAGVLFGLGYGNIQSISQAINIKIAPPHRLGLATATFFIFFDVGFGFGPYLFGFLVPSLGFRGLYTMTAVIILATIIIYYLLLGRKEKQLITGK